MKVQVKNLDHREYREMFREQEIVIPAGGSVEMGRSEAVAFLGQFIPMKVDGAGKALAPKKLKIVEDPEQHASARDQPKRYEAMDGTLFRTPEGLKLYQEKLEQEADTKPKSEVKDEPAAPRRRTRVTTAKR
jgi:hypothetical protein